MANVSVNFDTGLARYLEEAKRFPMLSQEEERDLAVAWLERGDQEALRQLIGSHMRLVVKAARSFSGYGLPLSELIAEGNVGLMQAAQKYDPERGFRFATYAIWWIRAQIQEYILHNWSLVKMGTTAAQKKLFFNLRRLKAQMEELGQGDLSPETVSAIAEELNVPETEVVEMNRRLAAGDGSLNATIGVDGDTDWIDMLMDDRPNQETIVANADELARRRELLNEALGQLNDRERDILVERRLKDDPSTLETLSRKYAVSRERVRQIEVRAFEKLQKNMLKAAQALNNNRPEMLEAA
jgi:RNA polymerase sigma-32 factor